MTRVSLAECRINQQRTSTITSRMCAFWVLRCGLMFCGLLWSMPALATPLRILVSASATRGLEGEITLRHANRDATRVRDLFVRLGGVDATHAILTVDATRESVLAAFARAKVLAESRSQNDVQLFFYFSGHGDRSKVHLAGTSLTKIEIATAMAQVPAGLRVAISDACRTRENAMKGPVLEPGFAIELPVGPDATGAVWVHASADGEPAQESDELQGAVFTHYWLSGLSGAADADGDRRVTLHESYTYAFNQTIFRTSQSAGIAQRPALDEQLKESAPLVLTEIDARSARVSMPQGEDAHYYVYTAFQKSVVAEGWSHPARRLVLALAPGRYIVQRRRPHSAAMELALGTGESRDLQPADFRAVPEEVLAQKGGTVDLHPHDLALGGGAGVGGLAAMTIGGSLLYSYRMSDFALDTGLSAAQSLETNAANRVRTLQYGARAGVSYRPRLSERTALNLGVALTLAYAQEAIERLDAGELTSAGYPTRRTASAWVPGSELRTVVRVEFTQAIWAELGPAAGIQFPLRDKKLSPSPYGAVDARIGVRF
jgi:Caspase domain